MGGGGEQKFGPGGLIPGIGFKAPEPFIPLRLAVFPSFPYLSVSLMMCEKSWGSAGYIRGFVLSLGSSDSFVFSLSSGVPLSTFHCITPWSCA